METDNNNLEIFNKGKTPLNKMKNTITAILFLFVLKSVNAQDSLQTTNKDTLQFGVVDLSAYNLDSLYKISYDLPESPYNKINAQRDIEKDSMSVIIHGGFLGFQPMDETLSAEFQKKYNVRFVYFGCLRYWNTESEDTDGYNEIIFAHLEKKYGRVVNTEFEQLWIDK